MKNLIRKIIYILSFILFFSGTTHAQATISVLRGQDFPPYHYVDKNGEITGFITEIVQGTFKLMGHEIEFIQYPWSRCITVMKAGQADAMMNLFKTDERKEFMYFAQTALADEINSFFVLKDRDIKYSGNIDRIKKYKLGSIRNYSYGSFFDNISFPFKYELETENDLVNALINKRCDVIVGNKIVIQALSKQMAIFNKIKALDPYVSKDPLYVAFSKVRGHKNFSKEFSEKLSAFKKTVYYKKILKKYSLKN